MEIKILGIEAKIQNKKEKVLANIVNAQLERIVEYWTTSEEWRESFTKERTRHWMINGVEGLLDAMFYMSIIKEPITALMIFNAVEREATEKMKEEAA